MAKKAKSAKHGGSKGGRGDDGGGKRGGGRKSKYGDRLKTMRENWKMTKDEPDFPLCPKGTYKTQCQDAVITESNTDGRLMVRVDHLIIEGEETGTVKTDRWKVEDEWGSKFCQQWIEAMAREIPDDPMELQEVVDEIANSKPIYTMQIKHNKGKDGNTYDNATVLRLLETSTNGLTPTGDSDDGNGEEESWSKGDVVEVDFEGEVFGGTITSIGKNGKKAKVEFEDGDKQSIPIEDLHRPADDEEPEGEDEEEDDDDDDDDDDDEVSLAQLTAFAESQEIDVKEDDDVESLSASILEYEYDTNELTKEENELLVAISAD